MIILWRITKDIKRDKDNQLNKESLFKDIL